MAKVVTCASCGTKFTIGKDGQHRRTKWHAVARTARKYRQAGLTYAEIGRQLSLSRMYVLIRLRREGL